MFLPTYPALSLSMYFVTFAMFVRTITVPHITVHAISAEMGGLNVDMTPGCSAATTVLYESECTRGAC